MAHRFAAAFILFLLSIAPVVAADWVAAKLRGTAEIQIDTTWQPLARGAAVPEGNLVRTGPESRLELSRGAEIIALGPETEVRIETDLAKSFTIIHQNLGTVEVEAEVKAVQHLEVRNKFLSAVVKGTIFVVTADAEGASVSVTRGLVAVQSLTSRETTSVSAGNSAFVRTGGHIGVAGSAPPAIFDASGTELPPATAAAAVPMSAPASGSDLKVADASLGLGSGSPQALLVTTESVAQGAAAAPKSAIDIGAAGIGIAIGIAIGALALLARRFFA